MKKMISFKIRRRSILTVGLVSLFSGTFQIFRNASTQKNIYMDLKSSDVLDRSLLQRAIDQAAGGRNILVLPASAVFEIEGDLKISCSIKGNGSKLLFKPNASSLSLENANDISISNLNIDFQGSAFNISESKGIDFEKCFFNNTSMCIRSSVEVNLKNSKIYSCNKAAIELENCSQVTIAKSHIYIHAEEVDELLSYVLMKKVLDVKIMSNRFYTNMLSTASEEPPSIHVLIESGIHPSSPLVKNNSYHLDYREYWNLG